MCNAWPAEIGAQVPVQAGACDTVLRTQYRYVYRQSVVLYWYIVAVRLYS